MAVNCSISLASTQQQHHQTVSTTAEDSTSIVHNCYQTTYNNKPSTPVVVDGQKVYIPALVHSPEYYENFAEPNDPTELDLQDDVRQLDILNISYDSKHLPMVLDHCRRDPQRYDKVRVSN